MGRMITYSPHIKCETSPGLRPDLVVVKVEDETGRPDFLEVGTGQITNDNGRDYLAVGVVQIDHAGQRALVEFPHEADSGRNRIWAPLSSFRRVEVKEKAS